MSGAVEVAPEDRSRAYAYALIGRLMYGPPEPALLTYVVQQPVAEGGSELARAWTAFQQACREVDLDGAREEYDELFVGVGKAAVTLYTAAYVAPGAPDRHLLRLRNALDGFGLARRTDAGETEDHVSALCDVMRWLIDNGKAMEVQRRFFFDYFSSAVDPLCDAILAAPQARFYRAVADFLRAYHAVERVGFDIG
jgi:TorA maturation chaperone TorD